MIPIYWNGLGWIVPLIIVGVNYLCYNLPGIEGYRDFMFIPGMLLSALVLWIAGNYLNFRDIPPIIINREKREMLRQEHILPNHRFYFFRIEYWAALPLGLLLVIFGFFLYLSAAK